MMHSIGHRLSRTVIFSSLALATGLLAWNFQQPAVRIEGAGSTGPRVMEKQTQTAVIRDYLQAWKNLNTALQQNQAELLDQEFVGVAKDKLANTIQEQTQAGIQTLYQDRTHDIKLVFYSPEGLSIQLIDNVEYDLQIRNHERTLSTQHVRSRFVAVLTPTEVRWKVRILQAISPEIP